MNVYINMQRRNELRGAFDSEIRSHNDIAIAQYQTFSAILSGRLVMQIADDGTVKIVPKEEAI
jgi:hypothetical protein